MSLFLRPGECGITAHVDFTELAENFLKCGWEILTLKTQAQFLPEQNIVSETGIAIDQYALKRLVDPRLMGELFKVLTARLM